MKFLKNKNLFDDFVSSLRADDVFKYQFSGELFSFNSSLYILDVNLSTQYIAGKDFLLFCGLLFFSADSFCCCKKSNYCL